MTDQLFNLLKNKIPPFNGTILVARVINDSTCRQIIHCLLKDRNSIYVNEDWNEHDGFINSSKQIIANLVLENIKTNSDYRNKYQSEFMVKWLLYSETFDLLFRYYLFPEDEDPEIGIEKSYFDIIGDEKAIAEVKEILNSNSEKYTEYNSYDYIINESK